MSDADQVMLDMNESTLRLVLACSRLVSLFRTASLSFHCDDTATTHAACETMDLIEHLLQMPVPIVPVEPTIPSAVTGSHKEATERQLLRLEHFAHRVLSIEHAFDTSPSLRDEARIALGMPPSEIAPTSTSLFAGRFES